MTKKQKREALKYGPVNLMAAGNDGIDMVRDVYAKFTEIAGGNEIGLRTELKTINNFHGELEVYWWTEKAMNKYKATLEAVWICLGGKQYAEHYCMDSSKYAVWNFG